MSKQNQKEAKKLPGFYIALCCCVLVIGIAGYFTEKQTDDSSPAVSTEVAENETSDLPVFSDEVEKYSDAVIPTPPPAMSAEEESEAVSEPVNEDVPALAQEEQVEDYAVDNPDVEGNAVTVASQEPVFVMPVSGEMLEAFSEALVYNSALEDWRTHNGVDIAAETGCSVQSAADGVVEKITDTAMGTSVQISHAADFVTTYTGLESVENLTEGKEIHSGEVIGTLGECKGENVTQPHLHFEISKGGEAVDPSDYLPY